MNFICNTHPNIISIPIEMIDETTKNILKKIWDILGKNTTNNIFMIIFCRYNLQHISQITNHKILSQNIILRQNPKQVKFCYYFHNT